MSALTAPLADIIEDFQGLGDNDKLQLLLEFSDELPALADRYAENPDRLEQVHECQSPLFLAVEVGADDIVHVFFDAPPEAPTTRGFASILHAGIEGQPAAAVLDLPDDLPFRFGLSKAVSPLRLRGMSAMLSRIKRHVRDDARD